MRLRNQTIIFATELKFYEKHQQKLTVY